MGGWGCLKAISIPSRRKIKKEVSKEILKVPSSGQIRSAREWYHWIGIEKEINGFRF
jgi:hypothetical protein